MHLRLSHLLPKIRRLLSVNSSVFSVTVLATLWALAFTLFYAEQIAAPHGEQAEIARHLANGDGFRSPFSRDPSAPFSAWSPPVYPFLISLAYRLFGVDSIAATWALLSLQFVAFGVAVGSCYVIARRLTGDTVSGFFAAGVISFHPFMCGFITDLWDGLLSTAIFLALLAFFASRSLLPMKGWRSFPFLAGAGWGVLLLTNATYLFLLPLLLWIVWNSAHRHLRIQTVCIAILSVVVITGPWMYRNWTVFGTFVPIRSGAGIQYQLGNTPYSTGWLDSSVFQFHPYANATERKTILALGEPSYDQLTFDRFLSSVSSDPLRYVESCVLRIGYLLIGNPTDPTPAPFLKNTEILGVFPEPLIFNLLILLFAFGGIGIWRNKQWSALPLVAAGLITLPYISSAVIDRYAIPVRAILAIYAGIMMAHCFRSVTSQISQRLVFSRLGGLTSLNWLRAPSRTSQAARHSGTVAHAVE